MSESGFYPQLTGGLGSVEYLRHVRGECGPDDACEVVVAVEKSARLSECGRYRYTLSRHWGSGEALMFVMLNPSTADADVDDPTIRRCIGFARREGYAGIVVQNLYALRATDPKLLFADWKIDPVGPENDAYLVMTLMERVRRGLPVVAAWGAGFTGRRDALRFGSRVSAVRRMVPGVDWRCLGLTKAGAPRHPLYVRGDQPLTPFGAKS